MPIDDERLREIRANAAKDSLDTFQKKAQAEFNENPEEYVLKRGGLGFNRETGLVGDAINSYINLVTLVGNPEHFTSDILEPIPKYFDYLKQTISHPAGMADWLITRAKPESVAEFDSLAERFNSELETIRQENDIEKVKYYVEELEKLFKREKK